MIYSHEVENMCPVKQGVAHGAAPIPEEAKWVKAKEVKETIEVAAPIGTDYSRFFDETSTAWEKDPEYNLMFLRAQQAHANDILKAKGYLFLNEVYRMLGIPETRAGQVVGWRYDPNNCDHDGDNYVDFNIMDVHSQKAMDFVNGYERAILLDFNVDGPIMDLVDWEK